MAAGRFIAVVGPSGVGKDTVMEAVAEALPNVVLARRVITRPSAAGGEEFDGVSDAAFDALVAEEAFALWWPAHGLRYGVPLAVDAELEAGKIVLANLSRAVLTEAQARFAGFHVLSLTAPVEVLSARLAQRGRESKEDIAQRLSRRDFALPEGLPVTEICNDGPLEQTVSRVRAVLQPERV